MTDAAKQPSKMSRGWRIVLIASLGVNLAVAGLFAGAAFRHGGHERASGHSDPMVRALDKDARRDIGREIRKHRENGKDMRGKFTAAFAEVLAVLRADEFDAAAMRTALERKSAVLRKSRDVGETALIAHLEGLSKAEREMFADRLEAALKHKKRR